MYVHKDTYAVLETKKLVAEHLGVKTPEVPAPPPVLDDEELFVIEGSGPKTSGTQRPTGRSPKNAPINGEKRVSRSSRNIVQVSLCEQHREEPEDRPQDSSPLSLRKML